MNTEYSMPTVHLAFSQPDFDKTLQGGMDWRTLINLGLVGKSLHEVVVYTNKFETMEQFQQAQNENPALRYVGEGVHGESVSGAKCSGKTHGRTPEAIAAAFQEDAAQMYGTARGRASREERKQQPSAVPA